jgi:hypothetical protein
MVFCLPTLPSRDLGRAFVAAIIGPDILPSAPSRDLGRAFIAATPMPLHSLCCALPFSAQCPSIVVPSPPSVFSLAPLGQSPPSPTPSRQSPPSPSLPPRFEPPLKGEGEGHQTPTRVPSTSAQPNGAAHHRWRRGRGRG